MQPFCLTDIYGTLGKKHSLSLYRFLPKLSLNCCQVYSTHCSVDSTSSYTLHSVQPTPTNDIFLQYMTNILSRMDKPSELKYRITYLNPQWCLTVLTNFQKIVLWNKWCIHIIVNALTLTFSSSSLSSSSSDFMYFIIF